MRLAQGPEHQFDVVDGEFTDTHRRTPERTWSHRRIRRKWAADVPPADRWATSISLPAKSARGAVTASGTTGIRRWERRLRACACCPCDADIHQEVEETFLVFQHLAPERRVVQRHGAMHQRPGSAIMEVRRNVLQLAVGDTLLDQLGQAFEVGGADLVQLLDHLRHLAGLHHLLFQAVEQAVALRIAHAELEVGTRQGFLVAGCVFRNGTGRRDRARSPASGAGRSPPWT